jgi:cytochrome P450
MCMRASVHAKKRDTTDWFGFGLVGVGDGYYDALAAKRRESPVELAAPVASSTDNLVIAYRYPDVARVISDQDAFGSDGVVTTLRPVLGQRSMMALGPAERRRFRSVLGSVLGPRNTAALAADILTPVVASAIARLPARGEADLVAEVTSVIPPMVIARLMGLDPQAAPLLLGYAMEMAGYLDHPKQAVQASRALRRLFEPVVEDRRRKPGDDLISALLRPGEAGETLSDEDVIALLVLLTWAGTETAFPGLGSLFYAMLTHPEQAEAVRRSPGLSRAAADEALRWETPVQGTCRWATRDTQVGDVEVPAGTTVFAHLGSANRDLPGIAEPDQFDIEHASPSPHLAFGLGGHRCIGIHVARMEMALTVEMLLAQHPRLRLADPCAAQITGHFVRGPVCLPVEIG